jgi:agmatinase
MPQQPLSIDERSWRDFAPDPLPGWCSRRQTAFDAPSLSLDTPPPFVETAVCSVSFDATATTRTGARDGPRAIREATLAVGSQMASRGSVPLRNMRTDQLQALVSADIGDYGDLHVYPSDPARQIAATSAEIRRVAKHAGRVVVLGGEQLITYPAFAGVRAAGLSAGRQTGFLQIDHHFDCGRRSTLHGPYDHGSNARLISELPQMPMSAIGFVGAGDLAAAGQLDSLVDAHAVVRSMRDIGRRGFDTCLHEALTELCSQCDQVYVSVDIDVCDSSTACGTGRVTVGGITATELLMLPAVLHRYPVAGLDIVEVNPSLDRAGVTAHLAARLLFEWLFLREVAESEAVLAPGAVAYAGHT